MITVISYGRAEKESWWSTPYCEIFSTGKSIDKNDRRQCLGSLPSKPAESFSLKLFYRLKAGRNLTYLLVLVV